MKSFRDFINKPVTLAGEPLSGPTLNIAEDFDFEIFEETDQLDEKATPTDVKWDMVTKEIRAFMKKEGIPASVTRGVFTGQRTIAVGVPNYDDRFTAEQIAKFTKVAKDLGLTATRSMPIDPDLESKLIDKQQWRWEFHG